MEIAGDRPPRYGEKWLLSHRGGQAPALREHRDPEVSPTGKKSRYETPSLNKRISQKVHIGKDVIDMNKHEIGQNKRSKASADKWAAYYRRREAEAKANEEKVARIIAEMEARKRALKAQQSTAD